ncbi:ATP-grasp fold amidoligase family protein [Luteococcus sanguinis]|uniref:ATP-grasp fold amidoligase family protein n=1 Tax=Luteococcus sanguinis TaxID=174038 RepID=A0ABW1WXU6_9ACTN
MIAEHVRHIHIGARAGRVSRTQTEAAQGRRSVALLTRVTEPVRETLRPLHRSLAASLPIYWRRKYLYAVSIQRWGNFIDPKGFGEKINWRILNDRRPIIVRACDKTQMKLMARERITDTERLRIARTLWTGTDVDQIPDELLASRAVLKPNDGSGEVLFLPATREVVREKTRGWLTGEQADRLGEWGYSRAEHVMLVEEQVPHDKDLPDYKFYVFNGRVRALEVHHNRFSEHRCSFFDGHGNSMPVESTFLPSSPDITLPAQSGELYALAAELGAGWDFIRIDLYLDAEGHVWFGEYSPYPHGGLNHFVPFSFDKFLGEPWQLPSLEEVRG